MPQNRKYIRIRKSDYEVYSGTMLDDKFFAYVEDYLLKNNIDYEINVLDRLIYVNGKIDALRIGRDLRLQTLEYFDGTSSQTIKLTKQAQTHRRQVAFVEDVETGAKQTLKHFKKNLSERLSEEFILRSEIINMKLATKAVLDKLIEENKLHVTTYKNHYYINRRELAKALLSKR